MNSRYSSYPGDVVKVVITRDQSVLQIKLASLLERRLILLLELGDIRGEVDVVEFYPPPDTSASPHQTISRTPWGDNGSGVRLHPGHF